MTRLILAVLVAATVAAWLAPWPWCWAAFAVAAGCALFVVTDQWRKTK